MDIISHFNKFVEENFNNFLKNYFNKENFWNKKGDIDNYINFMTSLDSFNYSFMTNAIKFYFEYIDDVFFHSSYRKSFCESKGFYKRTILTLFGEITFKRRYYVGSQFNDGKDHMIKAAVIFEDTELVYKTKKKSDSMYRFRLINSYTCASVENNLLNDTVDYIYNTYDVDHIKEIFFMGDCATWIKNFPKSNWFKFNPDTKVNFAMDGFHFSQALVNLTTTKYEDVYDALYEYVLFNKKNDFTRLCNEFLNLNPERSEVIESKRDYILNNWNERQLYQNTPHMRCSMESHISHIFADIFTSRPKAYSKKGIKQLLKLRLLKINKKNVKEEYFKQFKPKENKYNCEKEILKNNFNSNYLNKLLFKKFGNYTI